MLCHQEINYDGLCSELINSRCYCSYEGQQNSGHDQAISIRKENILSVHSAMLCAHLLPQECLQLLYVKSDIMELKGLGERNLNQIGRALYEGGTLK